MTWSRFPTELESDLLPKADIFDWHRGTRNEWGGLKLSSRRLLVLIDKLSKDSAYKRAAGGGYWTEAELIQAETYNEVARLRSSYYAINGGEESAYEPYQFTDPLLRLEQMIDAVKEDDEAEESSEQFYGEMGWS